MLSYRATLPIPLVVVRRVSAWLHHHRRRHAVRRYQRAATCPAQAVMFLRWLIDATPVHRLALDHGIPQAGTCTKPSMSSPTTPRPSKTS